MTRAGVEGSGVYARAAWYTAGRVVVVVLGGLVTAAATRALGTEDYGRFALFVAAVQLMALVMEGALRASIEHRQLNAPERLEDLMRTVLVLLIAFGLGGTALVAVLRKPLGALLGLDPWLAVLAAATGAGVAIWGPWLRLLVSERRSRLVSGLEVLRGAVQHSATLVLLLATAAVVPTILGVATSLGLLGLVAGAWWARRYPGRFRLAEARWAVGHSLPLLPHTLSHLMLAQIDRFIVVQVVGFAAAGLYSFGYSIGMLMGTFVGAMQNAFMPDFIERLASGDDVTLRRESLRYTVVVACGAFALTVAAEEAGLLLGADDFQEAVPIVAPVVFGYALTWVYVLFMWQSWQAEATARISAVTVIAGAVNVGLNYLLVPRYGYVAAAWTTLGSYALLVLLHWGVVRMRGERRLPLVSLLAVLVAAGAAAYGYQQLRPLFGSWWTALLGLKVPLGGATVLVLWRFGRPTR